ncbi:MAG TPA: hypothetical protein VMI93_12265 [Candidatus Solibacter sp.]|nr:hypothetical protein [Candidatus Solibacter sp.]
MRERRLHQGPRLSALTRPQTAHAPDHLSRYVVWAQSLQHRWAQRRDLRMMPALQTLLHAGQGKWISARWFRPVVQLAFHQNWNGGANPRAAASAPGLQAPVTPVFASNSFATNSYFHSTQTVLNTRARLLARLHFILGPMQAAPEGSGAIAARIFDVVWPMRLLDWHSKTERNLRTDTTRMVQRLKKVSQQVLQQTRRVEERRLMPEMRMQRMFTAPREIPSYSRSATNEFGVSDVRPAAGTPWTGGAMAGGPNIVQITDEVVRQLDRRFVASRERLGKI